MTDSVQAPYLYRKATLIANVGKGGDAGTRGRGGFGGGVNQWRRKCSWKRWWKSMDKLSYYS